MGTIYEKLNYLDGTKGLIREAINDKGGELTSSNTFREYVDAITNLPAGSGAAANVLCKVDFTTDTLPVKNISFRGAYPNVIFEGLLDYTPNPLGLHEYLGENDANFYVNMFVPLVNNTYSIKFGDVHANNLNRDFLEIRGLTVGSNGVITFSNSTSTNTVSVTASDSDTAVDLGIPITDFSNKTLSVKLDLTENSLGDYTTATWDTFKPYLYIYLDNTLVKRIVYDHVISVGYQDFSSINRNIYFMNISTNTDRWYPEILEIKCTADATTEDLTITNLNVTENGTYSESGKLYDAVTVNVEGGGSGTTVEALTVTENGTYSEDGKAYSPVTVALPLDAKTITSNGTYTASTDNLQGYSSVTVNVPTNGYSDYNITNNPITFTDGEDLPMVKCNGIITATQDLHGYSKPWAGGAGVNKYSTTAGADTWANNGSASHTNSDGVLIITCTSSEYSGVYGAGIQKSLLYQQAIAKTVSFDVKASTSTTITAQNNAISVTTEYTRQNITIPASTNASLSFYGAGTENTIYIKNISITEDGSTDYTPYSNICPISGVSSIDFAHSNKNLVNKVDGKQYVYIPSGTGINFEVENAAGVTVTLYGYVGDSAETLLTCESGYIESVATTKDYDGLGFTAEDITALGDGNVYVSIGDSSDMAVNHVGITQNITLDNECYGGTHDFITGTLTTTHGYISSYNGESLPSTWISDRDEYVSETTPTTGAEVVYQLNENTTTQFTPIKSFTYDGYNYFGTNLSNLDITILK